MAGLDPAISRPTLVTPTKVGVQLAGDDESKLDSGLRRNDDDSVWPVAEKNHIGSLFVLDRL
jgi:hypothetical protein